jgi:nucleoside-diphosphate-sugar epimerase
LFRGPSGRAYNVGSRNDLSIADLARTVCIALGRADLASPYQQSSSDDLSTLHYVPAVEKAETELNIRQHISLKDALVKTEAWLNGK